MTVDRTPAYLALTAVLVLMYIASVAMLRGLFRVLTGQESQLVVVAPALALAVLLNSPRRRIQRLIDDRFHRRNLERRYRA